MILHLGDCWRDAERLAERYPDIPMEHVPGNCDCRPEEPAEKLLFLGDCRVLICHGHTCGVKTSLLTAGLKAEQDHLDAFLFGHTHKPLVEKNHYAVSGGSGVFADEAIGMAVCSGFVFVRSCTGMPYCKAVYRSEKIKAILDKHLL